MSTENALRMDAIIFSLSDDIVWASWPDKIGKVKLGPSDAVTYMMRDFLAQCELGEQLTRKRASG